ncbi:MAG TPA: secondary thiamine-phosphate synthase enzyme YjbQ [Paludibaculum sp.]|jgi:secondary thiamine-phosphate synthase enzyme
MKQAVRDFAVRTHGKGLYEFTGEVAAWVHQQRLATGLLTLFCRHTSASLVIQENADPDVQTDLACAFDRLAPEDRRLYIHTMEGPDDMPAHIRSVLCGVQLSIPLIAGGLALGAWQGIYLFEHRASPAGRSPRICSASEAAQADRIQ